MTTPTAPSQAAQERARKVQVWVRRCFAICDKCDGIGDGTMAAKCKHEQRVIATALDEFARERCNEMAAANAKPRDALMEIVDRFVWRPWVDDEGHNMRTCRICSGVSNVGELWSTSHWHSCLVYSALAVLTKEQP